MFARLRRLARPLGVRRRDAGPAERRELAEDAESVGYDLGADIGQPVEPPEAAGFDLDRDVGTGNEPPDRRP